jgi:glycosyltransferase involved in cell wall biosynthesis
VWRSPVTENGGLGGAAHMTAPLEGMSFAFVMNSVSLFMSHYSALAARLSKLGANVTLIAPEGSSPLRPIPPDVRFEPVAMSRSSTNPVLELRTAIRLATLFRRLNFDLIHCVTAKAVIAGSFASRFGSSAAFVSTVSGLGFLHADQGKRHILRHAVSKAYAAAIDGAIGAVTFENEDDRSVLCSAGSSAARSALVIPGTGIACGDFEVCRPPPGMPIFAFVGRIIRHKGIDDFLLAARMLRTRGVSARFAVLGWIDRGNPTAVDSDWFLRECNRSGVEFWGFQTDMAWALSRVHCVVLPSWREGHPRALQEAAAAGLPAVTTDVPGCRDAVVNGITGIVVPVRDPVAVAWAVRRLAESPELRAVMGQAARSLARERFDSCVVHEAILDAYATAVVARSSCSKSQSEPPWMSHLRSRIRRTSVGRPG